MVVEVVVVVVVGCCCCAGDKARALADGAAVAMAGDFACSGVAAMSGGNGMQGMKEGSVDYKDSFWRSVSGPVTRRSYSALSCQKQDQVTVDSHLFKDGSNPPNLSDW